MITALSLRQPWCHAVLHLGKHIENRRWSTNWRGDFLIHASKGMTKKEYYECLETCTAVLGTNAIGRFPALKDLPRGGIVGAACLVDVLPKCPDCKYDDEAVHAYCGRDHGWHFPNQFGFVLENVRAAPRFVPCNGALGFFRVSDEVVAQLRAPA